MQNRMVAQKNTSLRRRVRYELPLRGVVAQLVERVVRNDEVRGSIPLNSTNSHNNIKKLYFWSLSLEIEPKLIPNPFNIFKANCCQKWEQLRDR